MEISLKVARRNAEAAPARQGVPAAVFGLGLGAAHLAIVLATALATGAACDLLAAGRIQHLSSYALAGLLTGLLYAIPQLVTDVSTRWPVERTAQTSNRVFEIWTFASFILALVASTRDPQLAPAVFLVVFYAAGLVALTMTAVASSAMRRRLVESGRIRGRRIMLYGLASELDGMAALATNGREGLHVVAAAAMPVGTHSDSRPSMLKSLDDVVSQARALNVDDIIVSSAALHDADIVARLSNIPVAIHIQTPMPLDHYSGGRITQFSRLSALTVSVPPLAPLQSASKRAFDIVAAASALLLLSPLLIVVAVIIKATSPGPVLFRQRRRGLNMREFRIWKFRTMTVMQDGRDLAPADQDEKRLTWIGRHLRRTNIDELPQLLNVLTGDMTIVGPRPHALDEDALFAQWIETYPSRAKVAPGITGWAQVNGCRGRASNVQAIRRRVEYDRFYIENWSMMFDLYIILLTVFSPKAYRNAR